MRTKMAVAKWMPKAVAFVPPCRRTMTVSPRIRSCHTLLSYAVTSCSKNFSIRPNGRALRARPPRRRPDADRTAGVRTVPKRCANEPGELARRRRVPLYLQLRDRPT